MSGGWSVSGGGTGIEARFDDLLAAQKILDDAADVLRERGARDSLVAADGDVLAALVLCPTEVAGVERAVLSATTLPGGALPLGLVLEAQALVLQKAVQLYRAADQKIASVREEIEQKAAFGLGFALGSNPVAAGLLGLAMARDPEGTMEFLYDHPWLLDAAARGAPGLVQGGSFGLASFLSVVPGGQPFAALLAGALPGAGWPTTDYEESVIGLQTLAGVFGVLQDEGSFTPRRIDRTVADQTYFDTSRDSFLRNLSRRQSDLVYGDPPVVEVVPVYRDGEIQSYVVQIPGTDPTSGFTHGTSAYDWVTDVQEMSGRGSAVRDAVAQAIRDADTGGKPLMLSGHSLGGILAGSMAADPAMRSELNIQSVVTYGSPVARFDIPDDVSVLSVEHEEDVVPMLEGRRNPDSANWTTIRTGDPHGGGDIIEAHDHGRGGYGQTLSSLDSGGGVPAEVQSGVSDWKDRNAQFFGDPPDPSTPAAQRHKTFAMEYQQ